VRVRACPDRRKRNMTETPKRKLAAIMFTDMVGYTALMQKDEPKARELIERHRIFLKPLVEKHGGEVIQYVGDGTFCRFESAIEAVTAAMEIHKVLEVEPEINLRIGIHIGDVVVDGDEVYGDGVNVASRIEPLAEAGGICVSNQVYENIKNQPGIDLRSLGKQELKNVEEPIEVYAIESSSGVEAVKSAVGSSPVVSESTKSTQSQSSKKLIYGGAIAVAIILAIMWGNPFLPSGERALEASGEIRSIAVLPLDNMSNDPDQEYFSDGMTEALIADIAKIRSLKVISRTSIMRYKGTDKSLPEIARELKVDAILEGSVMHAEGEVRITVQLIRAATDEHLWAESYTDKLENIMMLQSRIARAVAGEIKLTLSPEEKKNIGGERKVDPDAYNLYLQAQKIDRWVDLDRTGEAIELLEKALVIDENFIEGWIDLSYRISIDHFAGDRDKLKPISRAKEALERAKELDPTKIETLLAEGHFHYYGNKEFAEGLESYYRVLKNDPNNSTALEHVGYVQRRMGKWEASLEKFLEVYRKDPYNADLVRSIGDSYHFMRDFENAELFYKRVLEFEPKFTQLYVELALLAYQKTGDPKKALAAMEGATSVTRPDYIASSRSMYFAFDGNLEAALNEINSVSDSDLQISSDLSVRNYLIGEVYYFFGDGEKSREYFSLFLPDIQRAVEDAPKQEFLLYLLSFTYAHLGQKDDAISASMKSVELLPISEDALWGSGNESILAQIYMIVGEYDKALDKVEMLLSIPSPISLKILEAFPIWKPLHDMPRYQEIIKKYRPEA